MELWRHTTIGLGGPARAWVEPTSVEEVCAATPAGARVLVLGGGSNLVVADEGFEGTVVRLGARFARVEVEPIEGGVRVIAEAGASFDQLVERAVGEGWVGLEVLSGIPGSLGATPMQNVGAYGREIAELLEWVEVFDREQNQRMRLTAAECGFAYRHSRFRGSARWVMLRVALRLARGTSGLPLRYAELTRALGVGEGGVAPLAQIRQAVLQLRRQKGMVLDPADVDSRSCGSFFTNPIVGGEQADQVAERARARGVERAMPRFAADGGRVKLAAGWLIEHAGYSKGWGQGPVGLSSKHSLALIHRGGGRTRDLIELARTVRDGVREAFGVTLEPEPIFVGCSL